MNITNEITDTREIESIDISLKHIPFFSIESNSSINALYKILIKNPFLINMINEKKETFLSYAIKRNNNPIIDLLLTSPLLDLSYQDKNGNTYLHLSIIQQNLKLIKQLLEKKISINAKNNDGNTALHFAYYIKNIEIINILLNNKADINIKNKQGLIPEEIIPTNDIDKIAGYEYHMNFDINIYDELKYIQNNINEENNIKYNLNLNNNDINNNNIESKEKKEIQSKILKSKNNIKDNKNKNKIINDKNVNNKNINKNNDKNVNNDNNNSVKNNIDNNDNNNNTSNNKENNKSNSNKKINDEYKDLRSLPFHLGKAKRKISNIDKIYNENDRFFRKESENYSLYAELINTNNENSNYSLKKNKNKIKNLSNILENNNLSENSNDNIIFDNDIKNNNNSLLNNSSRNNKSLILYNSSKDNITNNSNNNNNNITIMQNIMINCSNKPLLDFLMQINLQKYYNNFNNNGFDNINMIIDNTKKGKYLTDNQLKNIGIIKAGDRAKILIRIQEKANLFEYNIPKIVYYICYHLEKIEDDINVFKLYEWLKNIKLEEYINNFLNNGYFSVDLLFVQLLSNNPLTDQILKNDLGIDKLGYRARILNKLKEELNSYSNNLKNSVVSFHTIENHKICSECIFC